MEVHALEIVKQEPIDPPSRTTDKRYNHDPPELYLPLPKFHRTLNPLDEQLNAALQNDSTIETDHVRSETVACDASELEETPAVNVGTTRKTQFVAEMVEYAFATCEGGNCKPETRMMVANLLQFLSKQYDEEKAVAVAEIARLKEQSKSVAENLQKSASELERVTAQNELKKRTSRDLAHENQELRTVIAAMTKDMEELKNGNDKLQKEFLSSSKTIEELKKAIHAKLEQYKISQDMAHFCMEQVKLLKSTIEERDRKIDLQRKEMLVFKEIVGDSQGVQGNPEGLIQNQELLHMGPILKEMEVVEGTAETAVPRPLKGLCVSLPPDAPECLKLMRTTQGRLFCAILALGRVLDLKSKTMFQARRTEEWNHCISKIIPHGYLSDTSPRFDKHVWRHWICANMFDDFESVSFGINEVPSSEPELLKENVLENCSAFQAFVTRKYHAAFPEWFYRKPVLGLLDEGVYTRFLAVAENAWKLHQIGLCCDPPASIFRPVPFETQYDQRYHFFHKINLQGGESVMLTVMPGFRVGECVFKSGVVLTMMAVR